MELVIRSLQVIVSSEIDIREGRELLLSSPILEVSRENCKGVLDWGYSYGFKTSTGIFYVHERTIYNRNMKIVGVYGKLNTYVTDYVKANMYKSNSRELFVNGDYVDAKLISALKRYNQVKVNVLSNSMFETLCDAPIRVEDDQVMLTSLMKEYLERNYGTIQNINILNEGDPLVRTPVQPTPVAEIIPNRTDVVFVDDTTEEEDNMDENQEPYGERMEGIIEAMLEYNTTDPINAPRQTVQYTVNPPPANIEFLDQFNNQLLTYLNMQDNVDTDLEAAIEAAIDNYVEDGNTVPELNLLTGEGGRSELERRLRYLVINANTRILGVDGYRTADRGMYDIGVNVTMTENGEVYNIELRDRPEDVA